MYMAKKITKKQFDIFNDIIESRKNLTAILSGRRVSLMQFNQWMKQKGFQELIEMSYKYNMIRLRFKKMKDSKIAHARLMKLLKTSSGDLLYKVCSKLLEIPDSAEEFKFPDSIEEKKQETPVKITDEQSSDILEILANGNDK